MANKIIESCIGACKVCADACKTYATENKGLAGMEHSVELCIACKDACNELITAGKTGAPWEMNTAKNVKPLVSLVQLNVKNIWT